MPVARSLKLLSLLVAVVVTNAVSAQVLRPPPLNPPPVEHLEPEDSLYSLYPFLEDSYDRVVVAALGEALDIESRVRVVAVPSFSQEFAVAVKEKDGVYRLLYLEPEIPLYREYVRLTLGGAAAVPLTDIYKSILIRRCERVIDAPLAQGLMRLWELMLRQTRFPNTPHSGADGESYHFSMPTRSAMLAGQIWSPPPNSNPGRLVHIVYLLKGACSDPSGFVALRREVTALTARVGNQ